MEGIIKYDLLYQPKDLTIGTNLQPLIAWRETLYRMHLIGKSAHKYGGMAYGNISQRTIADDAAATGGNSFLVTGTLTGHMKKLTQQHFCLVKSVDVKNSIMDAEGPCKPSSEALSHGAIYQLDSNIRFVIHIHCPELWYKSSALGITETDEKNRYGSPALAEEIQQLYESGKISETAIVAIKGHQDGLLAFGSDLDEVASLVIQKATYAFALSSTPVDLLVNPESSSMSLHS